jgi:phosphoribosyl 1,2-cyclic phosphodiesterase
LAYIYINSKVKEIIKEANVYLIESNYKTEELLKNTRYPMTVKKRIVSEKGHLSNEMCNQYLEEIISKETEIIMFAHQSPENNKIEYLEKEHQNINCNQKIFLEKEEITIVEIDNEN